MMTNAQINALALIVVMESSKTHNNVMMATKSTMMSAQTAAKTQDAWTISSRKEKNVMMEIKTTMIAA